MNRKFTYRIIGVLLFIMSSFINIKAVEIPVLNDLDSGVGSLRAAIELAVAGDVITFDEDLTNENVILLLTSINIDKSITISGNGPLNTMISGASVINVFTITGGGMVIIENLTIAGGSATESGGAIHASNTPLGLNNVTFLSCFAGGVASNNGGGAIYNVGGVVAVTGCTFFNNAATGAAGSGGAILNDTGGTLTVSDSFFSGNSSVRAGGAIEDNSGAGTSVTLNNCTLSGNTTGGSPGNGGGVHITGAGDININGGVYSENTASAEGGGLWNGTGVMTIVDVEVSGNTASGDGADQGGGGVFNAGGTVNISGMTNISNNVCDGLAGSGGGILNDAGGILTVNGATISGNSSIRAGGGIEDNSGSAGLVTLTMVTIDGNTTGGSPGNGGGVHITGEGNMNITGGIYSNNTASAEGGGLWNGTGVMTIVDVEVSGNTASGDGADQGGGGVFNAGGTVNISGMTNISNNVCDGLAGSGGGILNDADGTLTVNGATISGNSSIRAGGGIEDNSGSATTVIISDTNIDLNTTGGSPGNGGGIHISGNGDMEITGGAVIGNTASAEGGGLWNGIGTMTIAEVLINMNVASGDGADQGGGGVFNAGGTVIVNTGTTIMNNDCNGMAGSGGGILNDAGGTLTINGATISGNTSVRAGGGIEDNSGANSTINLTDVTIKNNITGASPGNGGGVHITGSGDINITGGVVSNNTASTEGGGLWNGAGLMTIADVEISGNSANGNAADQGGGGIYNLSGTVEISGETEIKNNTCGGMAGSGGGILNDVGATLTIDGATISGNSAVRAGGGIEDNSGSTTTVILTNVTLDGNTAGASPGNGGAIHITGEGNMDITGGTVVNNSAAAEGGGLWNGTGLMTVTQVNIEGNFANGEAADNGGGGIFNNGGTMQIMASTVASNQSDGAAATGGGIHNTADGDISLMVSTISGNDSAADGGGISNHGTITVTNSTIAMNNCDANGGGFTQSAGASATFTSTIIAENNAMGDDADFNNTSGMQNSGGYNIVGNDDNANFQSQSSDQIGTTASPKETNLQSLSNNGGPTKTHAFNSPSVACDRGNPDDNTTDQRGESVANDGRDVGAFENQDMCSPNFTTNVTLLDGSSVFPNPVLEGWTKVEIPENFGTDMTIRIMNTAGQTVLTNSVNIGTNELNIKQLSSGSYILQIIANNGMASHKLMVQQ